MMLLLGCESPPKDEVTLQVGAAQAIQFEVESGFAHYYELPGHGDVLRIVLASYEVGCMEYLPPSEGEVFVTITLRLAPNETINTGKYPWSGLVVEGDGDEEDPTLAPRGVALPFVRLAQDARALPPGGYLELRKFVPERFGMVAGELAFRDAIEGQAATTALLGSFEVRLCHTELDEARRAPPGGP